MTTLITGGGGFLGGHLARLCAANGEEVVALYRSSMPPEDKRIQPVQLDLLDESATARVVARFEPSAIYHLAGQSSTAQSWKDPAGTYRDNVLAQSNLLKACRDIANPPRLVIASSSDVYGSVSPEQNPLRENLRPAPFSPYGSSKVAQEILARRYLAGGDMEIVIARPFLQIGPNRSDRFFSGAFARQVVEVARGIAEPVIRVGNLDLVRDMTDVRDVAAAFRLLMQKGTSGGVYNIASGEPRTLRSLLELMMETAGVSPRLIQNQSPHREQEPLVVVGSPERIRAHTGWTPVIDVKQTVVDMLSDWETRIREPARA